MSSPEQRAGDLDRDRVAALLREALAEGRLDIDELNQRLDATYRAKTFGELAVLTSDLPAPSVPAPAPAPRPVVEPPQPQSDRRELAAAWTAWAVAVSINVVIWLLVSFSAGGAVYFWPMWVAGPWGAVLVVLSLLAPRR